MSTSLFLLRSLALDSSTTFIPCTSIYTHTCIIRSFIVQFSMYQSKSSTNDRRHTLDLVFIDATISTSLPARLTDHYETLSARLSYENCRQLDSVSRVSSSEDRSLLPPFQRLLPIVPVAILGSFEVFAGVIVLILEVLIFDIAVGLWCGLIYALAGVAAIVFGSSSPSNHARIHLSLISDRH